MKQATRYRCTTLECYAERFLPEDPHAPAASIRAGCEQCGRITRHEPVG